MHLTSNLMIHEKDGSCIYHGFRVVECSYEELIVYKLRGRVKGDPFFDSMGWVVDGKVIQRYLSDRWYRRDDLRAAPFVEGEDKRCTMNI